MSETLTKEQRKKAMPLSSGFVEAMREAFSEPNEKDPIVFIKATEAGHSIEWGVDIVGRGPEFQA